jgi:hypothetical protein
MSHQPAMTPPPTAESVVRNLLQTVQAMLELAAAGDLLLPRANLETWQRQLLEALAALQAGPQALIALPPAS